MQAKNKRNSSIGGGIVRGGGFQGGVGGLSRANTGSAGCRLKIRETAALQFFNPQDVCISDFSPSSPRNNLLPCHASDSPMFTCGVAILIPTLE